MISKVNPALKCARHPAATKAGRPAGSGRTTGTPSPPLPSARAARKGAGRCRARDREAEVAAVDAGLCDEGTESDPCELAHLDDFELFDLSSSYWRVPNDTPPAPPNATEAFASFGGAISEI